MQELNGFLYPESDYLHHEPRWRKLAETLDVALGYVTQWHTAIDAGAYVGFWACGMAERFENVYAFEPIYENIVCVRRNCPANVMAIHMAVSDHVGRLPMTLKGAHYGEASPKGDFTVQAVTLDSFQLDRVGFIKFDVEHLEPQAIDGARATIERDNPVICVETKWNRDAIAARLEQHGYEMVYASAPDEVWICSGSS